MQRCRHMIALHFSDKGIQHIVTQQTSAQSWGHGKNLFQGGRMRLICPNCGAQYEVPDGVVPEQGRDVQCSNCGHTWFQAHPDHDQELAEELGQELPADAAPISAEPAPEAQAVPEPEPEDLQPDAEEPDAEEPEEEPEPELDPELEQESEHEDPAPARTPRRELDPAIADLLREEAEFEARQRAAEAEVGLQTQTEMGLDAPVQDESTRRAEEARRRMASRQGLSPEDDDQDDDRLDEDELAAHVGSRRELLPDIEEINSSLNADSRKTGSADDDTLTDGGSPARKRSGFRSGFFLGVLLIVLLWSVHLYSAQIAQAVPQLSGPLQRYSTTVEKGQAWLNNQVKSLLIKLDEMAAASEE